MTKALASNFPIKALQFRLSAKIAWRDTREAHLMIPSVTDTLAQEWKVSAWRNLLGIKCAVVFNIYVRFTCNHRPHLAVTFVR